MVGRPRGRPTITRCCAEAAKIRTSWRPSWPVFFAGAFFAGAFFAVAFFAAVFLAGAAFFAAVFLAGAAFFAGVFVASFLAAAFLAGALAAGDFFARVLAAVFLVAVDLLVVFLARLVALAVVFLAGARPWQGSLLGRGSSLGDHELRQLLGARDHVLQVLAGP